jgi:molybdopterin-guanine dinucleotide biosynthesis protein A
MGSDKMNLEVAGEALWRRQARVLREAGAERVLLIRRPGQGLPEGITTRRDLYANSGPLAGLQAALVGAAEPWIAVLAVDMPGIDAAWFRWLGGFCGPGIGVMVGGAEGFEPLAAIYPREALAEITGRLQRRDLALQRLARNLAESGRLRVLPVSANAAGRTANLNTPGQFVRWSVV